MARGIIDRAATTGRWGRGKKASPNVVAGAQASVAQRKSFSAGHKLSNAVELAQRYTHGWKLLDADHAGIASTMTTTRQAQAALTHHDAMMSQTRGATREKHRAAARVYKARREEIVMARKRRGEQGTLFANEGATIPTMTNPARDLVLAEAAERGMIDLGRDGAKWRHGWLPLNGIAAAIKAKKYHGGGGKASLPSGKSRINVGANAEHAMAPKGKARATAAQRARAEAARRPTMTPPGAYTPEKGAKYRERMAGRTGEGSAARKDAMRESGALNDGKPASGKTDEAIRAMTEDQLSQIVRGRTNHSFRQMATARAELQRRNRAAETANAERLKGGSRAEAAKAELASKPRSQALHNAQQVAQDRYRANEAKRVQAEERLAAMTAIDFGHPLKGHSEVTLRSLADGDGKYASHARSELASRGIGDGTPQSLKSRTNDAPLGGHVGTPAEARRQDLLDQAKAERARRGTGNGGTIGAVQQKIEDDNKAMIRNATDESLGKLIQHSSKQHIREWAMEEKARREAGSGKVSLTGNERYNLTTGERLPDAAPASSGGDLVKGDTVENSAGQRMRVVSASGDNVSVRFPSGMTAQVSAKSVKRVNKGSETVPLRPGQSRFSLPGKDAPLPDGRKVTAHELSTGKGEIRDAESGHIISTGHVSVRRARTVANAHNAKVGRIESDNGGHGDLSKKTDSELQYYHHNSSGGARVGTAAELRKRGYTYDAEQGKWSKEPRKITREQGNRMDSMNSPEHAARNQQAWAGESVSSLQRMIRQGGQAADGARAELARRQAAGNVESLDVRRVATLKTQSNHVLEAMLERASSSPAKKAAIRAILEERRRRGQA